MGALKHIPRSMGLHWQKEKDADLDIETITLTENLHVQSNNLQAHQELSSNLNTSLHLPKRISWVTEYIISTEFKSLVWISQNYYFFLYFIKIMKTNTGQIQEQRTSQILVKNKDTNTASAEIIQV